MFLRKTAIFLILTSIVALSIIGLLATPVHADEIEDAIMQKWQAMRDRGLDIGEPMREVVDAWGSPYGTTPLWVSGKPCC